MRIRDQLDDVRLKEFYIHSPDVKNHSADEVSVSEILFRNILQYVPLILHNCKKLKGTKIASFKISSILSME